MYRILSRIVNKISAPSKLVVGIDNSEVEMRVADRIFQKEIFLQNPDKH